MGLLDQLNQYHDQVRKLREVITLEEYLERVRKQPALADLAHARLYRMIEREGVERDQESVRYRFFDGRIVGNQPQLQMIMEYLRGAALGMDVRKRMLLLIGPPGSGKSTLLIALKEALEQFSLTPEGAVYGIRGCPMHEEPLHLIPKPLRPDVMRELGVTIEGELCPLCQWRYNEEGLEHFEVERLLFSEKNRVGIGSYVPGTEKDMSVDDLVGSLDFSKITEYGTESDPRAYRFDGELNVANRGLMDCQEFLKLTPEMKYLFLGLAQENNIKTKRFALIYADEVVIAHSNLNEYAKFVGNKENEAIMNRMFVVYMPYALKVSDEVQVYQHMMRTAPIFHSLHIAPHTLRVMAMFTVLSRLAVPKDKNIGLMDKLKLYNGDAIKGFQDHNLEALQKEDPHEGLRGLSPRDAMNVLAHAAGRAERPCIDAMETLLSIKEWTDGEHFLAYTDAEQKSALHDFRNMVREEFDLAIRRDVQEAFIHAFDEAAETLFENYLVHADASVNKNKVKDMTTGEMVEPNMRFLRQVEETIRVGENAALAFRTEILTKLASIQRQGKPFRWDSHPRLKEAIEAKLFADSRSLMVATMTTHTPDEQQRRRMEEVEARLIAKGYCEHCAKRAIMYVGRLMQQEA